MRDFLIYLQKLLTTDNSLTALIPAENIGASVRQDVEHPALEHRIDSDETDNAGHRSFNLFLTVYSDTGAELAADVKDRLERLLTALNLTPKVVDPPLLPALTFKVSQVRLTDSRPVEPLEWVYALRCEFRIRLNDLRPQLQKQ